MWATGNGGLTDDDCNCDGYTTSVYTISIGAISDHGLSTYYTESCSSTLAVTFSGGSHREKKENKIVSINFHKILYICTKEQTNFWLTKFIMLFFRLQQLFDMNVHLNSKGHHLLLL